MTTSILLAKLFSIYLIVGGLALALNIKDLKQIMDDVAKSKALHLVISLTTLMLGAILVLVHNLWVADWRIIITIIAWVIFTKGIVNALAPAWVIKFGTKMVTKPWMKGVIFIDILLGLYLAYIGFTG